LKNGVSKSVVIWNGLQNNSCYFNVILELKICKYLTIITALRGVAIWGEEWCRTPQRFTLSANLQYTFLVGNFGLREVFPVGQLGLPLLEKICFATPLTAPLQ